MELERLKQILAGRDQKEPEWKTDHLRLDTGSTWK